MLSPQPVSVQGSRERGLPIAWFAAGRAGGRQSHGSERAGKAETSLLTFPSQDCFGLVHLIL